MASRVLYVLLLLITLLLCVLAPLHIRETLDWKLELEANVKGRLLIDRLVERRQQNTAVGRIWELLPEATQAKLLEFVANRQADDQDSADTGNLENQFERMGREIELSNELIEKLNEIIQQRDFYRSEDWPARYTAGEITELLDVGVDKLSDVQVYRLNRLLIAAAVYPAIESGSQSAIQLRYAIWEIPIPIRMSQPQFAQILTASLPFYFDKFVMSIGLLIAIIVTANMIPETFEPGSLNLLLSKPVSRWGLFTAKFFGGCVFIGLCAFYLFFGVWLWLGLSMGIWDRSVLLSIPLYIVVFAIYFAVSAFIGLLYRSPIVSVIITLLFWVICFALGAAYGFVQTRMKNESMVQILPTPQEGGVGGVAEGVMMTRFNNQLQRWDAEGRTWQPMPGMDLDEQTQIMLAVREWIEPMRDSPQAASEFARLSPRIDPISGRIIANRLEFGFGFDGYPNLFAANPEEKDLKYVGRFPRDTVEVFQTVNGIVAYSSDGDFHRLDQDRFEAAFAAAQVKADDLKKAESAPDQSDTDPITPENASDGTADESVGESQSPPVVNSGPVQVRRNTRRRDTRGRNNPTSPSDPITTLFDSLEPQQKIAVRNPSQIAYCRWRDEFLIYDRGTLYTYQWKVSGYQLHAKLPLALEFDPSMTALLAASDQEVLIAFGNGKVISVNLQSLQEENEFQLTRRHGVREIRCSSDGAYCGVLYRDGSLWISDSRSSNRHSDFSKRPLAGQGKVETFAFTDDGKLWVCYDIDRLVQIELSDSSRQSQLIPSGNLLTRAYRIGIRPLYRVFPKPGEFYKLVTHLSDSGDAATNEEVDLNKVPPFVDPWLPLWSGLGFMVFMLAISCFVFQRKDF